MQVHADGSIGDGLGVPLRLHNLLLALAGRIDDTALSEARELVARAHLDEAAELAAGTLIAGRIPITSAEQRELALVLEISRSDPTLADQVVISEPAQPSSHRFTAADEPERGLSAALERPLQVLPDVRSVHAVWRSTPAGVVPGPLPQRVVLVEVGAQAHPPAVAYRLDTALRRAGIRATVEVTGPGAPRHDYHEAALSLAAIGWLADQPEPAEPEPAEPESAESNKSSNRGRHVAKPAAPAVKQATTATEPTPSSAESTRKPSVFEDSTEHTTELTAAQTAQLEAALAADPARGRAIANAGIEPANVVELPELDLNDPQLSDRDRELLRELHTELAARERAEAAAVRRNIHASHNGAGNNGSSNNGAGNNGAGNHDGGDNDQPGTGLEW